LFKPDAFRNKLWDLYLWRIRRARSKTGECDTRYMSMLKARSKTGERDARYMSMLKEKYPPQP
jgi:hypothetical protein